MTCTNDTKFSSSSLLNNEVAQSCSSFIIFSLSTFFILVLCICRNFYVANILTTEGPKRALRTSSTSCILHRLLPLLKFSANFSPSFRRLVRHAGDGQRLGRLHHGQRHGALPHPVTDAPQSNSQHVHHQQRDWRHRHRGRRPRQGGEWSLVTSRQHKNIGLPSLFRPATTFYCMSRAHLTLRSQPATKTDLTSPVS